VFGCSPSGTENGYRRPGIVQEKAERGNERNNSVLPNRIKGLNLGPEKGVVRVASRDAEGGLDVQFRGQDFLALRSHLLRLES